MYHKIRQVNGLNVTRDQVYVVMTCEDPEGLEKRKLILKKKKMKSTFTSVGPNWVLSTDGHNKLMGYQNSTFSLAVYGCIDTASRKCMYISIYSQVRNRRLPAINLSEIFHSGLYYSNYLIYLFLEQIPNTIIAFYFLLVR